ncbi:repressor of the inhibitor of the protein kinase [Nymphon striatum]|nr:repressor of the inhibitor of the protein kinase [Nymphon striatum]
MYRELPIDGAEGVFPSMEPNRIKGEVQDTDNGEERREVQEDGVRRSKLSCKDSVYIGFRGRESVVWECQQYVGMKANGLNSGMAGRGFRLGPSRNGGKKWRKMIWRSLQNFCMASQESFKRKRKREADITTYFITKSTSAISASSSTAPTPASSSTEPTFASPSPTPTLSISPKVAELSLPALTSTTDISSIIEAGISHKMTDASKIDFLENCWKPPSNFQFEAVKFKIGQKMKNISFQRSWLEEYKWLRYSNNFKCKGGWCLPCVLCSQLDQIPTEKAVFVKSPFTNFNKSKELLRSHELKKYHKENVQHLYIIRSQMSNPEFRIDSKLNTIATDNIKNNRQVLPTIVDAVMYCAKQQISLRGHRDAKINFNDPAGQNEGNFVALIRLLAKQNLLLKAHVTSGPKNTIYTSKTIQNQIISIAADIIRDYFKSCLTACPHYSIIADETTSNGREILSVCLRLLDTTRDKITKQEVLLDMVDLNRITGESIAFAIRDTLKKEHIQIADCKGQAYDTTASMSSGKKGVQSYIKKWAPKADYQGCVLHSLNLVICRGCKIPAIRNMMDSCMQLFLFFDNSPKRQKFLQQIIAGMAPDTKKHKLKNICATRWSQRHTTFDTLQELYVYIIRTLEEMINPTGDDNIYTKEKDWNWDAETRSMANGLRHTFTSFEHIVSFIIAKQGLEPMCPLVSCLQGEMMDVYHGFQKVDQIVSFYENLRSTVDDYFPHVYDEAKNLAESVNSEEKCPRISGRQSFRANAPALTTSEYYKRNLAIPFLDTISHELASRFGENKRAHFELCSLIPNIISIKNATELNSLTKILTDKWESDLPRPTSLFNELLRWQHLSNNLKKVSSSSSVSYLIQHHADTTFFPNVRELLSILAVLPLGSCEAERSFSCVRRIHSWLRSSMSTDRLSDLCVIAMHSNIPVSTEEIVNRFITLHPRRMQGQSLFSL